MPCQRCKRPAEAYSDPTLPVWCDDCHAEFRERMSDFTKRAGCE